MAKWFLKKCDADIERMSKVLGISPVLCTILADRGINSKTVAQSFLHPSKEGMHDTSGLKDIDQAVNIIVKAVAERKKIAVYGDYDVDGVMSTVILYKALKKYGADVIYHIPHREEEGYGLNINAIKELAADDISLMITCDNGISAIDEIKYAKSLDMAVIIIDHHEPSFSMGENNNKIDIIPEADAVIDPKQMSCPYPFKMMCAGALSYKFVKYFYTYLELDFEEEEYLILGAIATICDIVDLIDENRIIVKLGLALLSTKMAEKNLGLNTLLEKRNLKDKLITTFDVGFIIGPCINATGRLESAAISVDLFLTEDRERANELADKLIELNEQRKDLTAKSVEHALESIRNSGIADNKVIVYYDSEIHESVAGIVAGRIKEEMYRPTIVLTDSGELIKGSARSIEGYNIFEELLICKDLFERFGGHSMAAGMSLMRENLDKLDVMLNAHCKLKEQDFTPIIRIDKQMNLEDVTYTLANELSILEPYGKANSEPVFGTKGLTADIVEIIGARKNTLRFVFDIAGRKIKAVCFNQVDKFRNMLRDVYGQSKADKFSGGIIINIKVDIVYHIDINEYNNNKYVNMKIIDFRLVN